MRKKAVIICMLFISSLLLIGCGNKVTYVKGFPTKDSPALSEFLGGEMASSSYNLLYDVNGMYVYTGINLNEDDREIMFHFHDGDDLKTFYEPLFYTKDVEKTFNNLWGNDEFTDKIEQQIANKDEFNLPTLKLEEKNQLYVKTRQKETILDLPELMEKFKLKPDDELVFNLYNVNADHFIVYLKNLNQEEKLNKSIALFIKQDLSRIVPTSTDPEAFNKTLASGELDEFHDLFSNVKSDHRFEKTFIYRFVYDRKDKQLKEIGEEDYLSEDGKYVYLNGAKGKLEDGIQRIQKIENYLAGNDTYEAEFKISFKKIAKEAGIKSAAGVGIAKIVYFNKDYIILGLHYHAPIVGDAGSTNVIIDLQGDKKNPTAYVVDLDWF
ncbi:hypothetical protein H1Z61_17245 [Bacillus aquiflavi]|uniref:Lipoprotein n=1 Tax=Bacillus aquiflavi TaxID=2672567 RepID=A0A6B3VY35_9BACI|nr:hypothetical protein [Bacillus aquiflavi]MBA4538821.1 hypothetical protein [Bacillus aquiflavi]NEY83180.1 hypothetical protein [Bacillus aquiflavi]